MQYDKRYERIARDQYSAATVLYIRFKNTSDITVATCCGSMRRENPKGTLKFWPHTLRLIPRLMLLRRASENFCVRFKLAASAKALSRNYVSHWVTVYPYKLRMIGILHIFFCINENVTSTFTSNVKLLKIIGDNLSERFHLCFIVLVVWRICDACKIFYSIDWVIIIRVCLLIVLIAYVLFGTRLVIDRHVRIAENSIIEYIYSHCFLNYLAKQSSLLK